MSFCQAGDLNLDYFLRNRETEIVRSIGAGEVDPFLDAIVMIEGIKGARPSIKQAVRDRKAATGVLKAKTTSGLQAVVSKAVT